MTLPSLKAFGIKENQIVFLNKKSNIKVVEVPIASSCHHAEIFRKIYPDLTAKSFTHCE
jgi:hypothetical protein